ncbi:MAG: aminodeoxychorismate/anthranilate synthase component II [Sphingomonas sp.]|nr:aminodeoxychorismate/anthranilate synthase component II [Sphingomonas sp.]RZV53555.1 MAG: aminodeoxychorismate/anthranilate synthase component II [Sphingomonadaceae bacterium]
MKILLVDNRDSFTFNLVDAMREGGAEVRVVRNSIAAQDALDMANGGAIMLSPGPGTPDDAGCCLELIGLAKAKVPLIGICLGHQAIVQQAGGCVARAWQPFHGKTSALVHGGRGPFAELPDPLTIGRYHSLCTPTSELPGNFTIDAEIDGMAMAIRDEAALQLGLQFHPESILTPLGHRLAAALADWAQVHLAKEPAYA